MSDWNNIRILSKEPQFKTTCPLCSHSRKNKTERCLSVNQNDGVAYCHNCGATITRDKDTTWQGEITTKRKPKAYAYNDSFLTDHFDESNGLFKGISKVFGYEDTKAVFSRFKVSTKGNQVTWHYLDKKGLRYAKTMLYMNGTKRGNGFIATPKEFRGGNYSACLFGLHLESYKKPNIIVESEKTALVGTLAYPEYNWLATGGSKRLNLIEEAKLWNHIHLMPDKNEDTWVQYAKMKGWSIIDDLEHNEQVPKGGDFADLFGI